MIHSNDCPVEGYIPFHLIFSVGVPRYSMKKPAACSIVFVCYMPASSQPACCD